MATNTAITSLSREEKQLINRIREIRIDSNKTQEELSVAIGMNANYLGLVETHRRGLSLKALFKLAKELRVQPITFFQKK